MGKQKRPKPVEAVPPTERQQERSTFVLDDVVDRDGARSIRVGKAYRKVRMVELLERRGTLTADEAGALRHYRHHADMADRSPVRDSLNQQRGGSGCGPTIAMLNALRLVSDCEAAAGSLAGILRAVVVDDITLEGWADDRGYRRSTATLDIRMAAARVMAELDA